MPITSTDEARLNQLVHEAVIYTACTKPADAADVVLTAGVPAGGIAVGMTSGPTQWTYKPTLDGININEATGKIAYRKTDEAATVSFTCALADYKAVELAMQDGKVTTTPGAAGVASVTTISVGGKTDVTPQCVVLVSKAGEFTYMSSTVICYEWIVIYNAVSVDGADASYERNKTRMIKVTLNAIPDVTRAENDQLLKYGFQYNYA